MQQAAAALAGPLAIDDATAVALVKGGMASLDTIVEVEPQDIADAIGVELERATEIHAAAKRAHESHGLHGPPKRFPTILMPTEDDHQNEREEDSAASRRRAKAAALKAKGAAQVRRRAREGERRSLPTSRSPKAEKEALSLIDAKPKKARDPNSGGCWRTSRSRGFRRFPRFSQPEPQAPVAAARAGRCSEAEAAAAAGEGEAKTDEKIIHLKPPIIVKDWRRDGTQALPGHQRPDGA